VRAAPAPTSAATPSPGPQTPHQPEVSRNSQTDGSDMLVGVKDTATQHRFALLSCYSSALDKMHDARESMLPVHAKDDTQKGCELETASAACLRVCAATSRRW
jgi:hypothetical protein